ncbi:hypothetical protein [Motiliproteus sediminis]|uniref:hypothetical protein n=1 Tax=Motiliproteus sediminis TaxID=1468178 RepID=UPI001AEFF064|nr:hypothetical protein [Motiliproteus sediminis]
MSAPARAVIPPGGLFPRRMRELPGGRWTRIGLRTLHLVGVAGVGGAYLYPIDPALWHPYLLLTLLSGAALLLSEVWSHGIWLIQLRGLFIALKCVTLGLGLLLPATAAPGVLITAVVISGVIAHAPGRFRYYSPWHRRVYTYDDWLNELEAVRAP